MISATLALRRKSADLFSAGDYQPIAVTGAHAERVIAFARRSESSLAVTVVPRAASRLLRGDHIAFESANWADTAIALQQNQVMVDAFSQTKVEYAETRIAISKLFQELPFALLVSSDLVR